MNESQLTPEPLNPEIPPPPASVATLGTASEASAQAELQGFAEGNLDREAATQEFERTQNLRWHIHWVARLAVWLGFGLGISAVAILAFHELAPARWAWLTLDQLSQLRTFLFSSAATSVLGTYMKKRLD